MFHFGSVRRIGFSFCGNTEKIVVRYFLEYFEPVGPLAM
jgi:hypothetical protein